MRILYAADNRKSSYFNLQRFLLTFNKFHTIKIAAYIKSAIDYADWTLDALLNFSNPTSDRITFNSNFNLYHKEIKNFNPDLIITDLEPYTSYAAIELGKPLWQISPLLLKYAIIEKSKGNAYKYYSALADKDTERHNYFNQILQYSTNKFLLSHLGDLTNAPAIKSGFTWVRPKYEYPHYICYDGSTIPLCDAYYAGQSTKITNQDTTDQEALISAYLNVKYGLSTMNESLTREFEININPKVKFVSEYLK